MQYKGISTKSPFMRSFPNKSAPVGGAGFPALTTSLGRAVFVDRALRAARDPLAG
jgi:hypothetical protein